LASLLTGGDRRSIGQADAVAARVAEQPALLAKLWDCLADADPVVRMRAADALEKISRATPAAFNRYKASSANKCVGTPTKMPHQTKA